MSLVVVIKKMNDMKVITLLLTLLISSCSSKMPMQFDVKEYRTGLELTRSTELLPKSWSDNLICINFPEGISNEQMVRNDYSKEIHYTYLIEPMIHRYQESRSCKNGGDVIVESIDSQYKLYNTMRLHRYTTYLNFKVLLNCDNNQLQKEVNKEQLLIIKSFHGFETTKSILSSAFTLVFDDVVLEVNNLWHQNCTKD